jgi:hypothetical protein
MHSHIYQYFVEFVKTKNKQFRQAAHNCSNSFQLVIQECHVEIECLPVGYIGLVIIDRFGFCSRNLKKDNTQVLK